MVFMLLLLLTTTHMTCTEDAMKCPASDPVLIPQEWLRPGDILIGGIMSQLAHLFPTVSFQVPPAQELGLNHPVCRSSGLRSLLCFFVSVVQLHPFLQSLSFNNAAGKTVSFNERGEIVAGFDITSVVMFPNTSFRRAEIGMVHPSASEVETVIVDGENIVLYRGLNQVCI
ncbi:hypothetical protein lerEdw1_016421 [Lerista edwardsae]|nr:hypothetical protein lerEdw1_016421 [Lerista edwardsae]